MCGIVLGQNKWSKLLVVFFFSRRLGADGSSRDSSDDFTEVNRSQSQAATISQNLLVEIRQAVNEAQPKGKWITK